MGLLEKIKSALGIGGSSRPPSADTTVTVERERDPVPTTDSEPESTPGPDADTERAVKEAAPDAVDEGASKDEGPEPDAGSDEGVESIKGIGPAYAERLGDAGIGTVGELAGADAAELADATDIAEGRIEGWIERANAR